MIMLCENLVKPKSEQRLTLGDNITGPSSRVQTSEYANGSDGMVEAGVTPGDTENFILAIQLKTVFT